MEEHPARRPVQRVARFATLFALVVIVYGVYVFVQDNDGLPDQSVIAYVVSMVMCSIFVIGDRGVVPWSLPILVCLHVLIFSQLYWGASFEDAQAFSEPLSKVDAVYLTLATLTTTGFGDIHAQSQEARLLVSLEMATSVALVAVLVASVTKGLRYDRAAEQIER
jgi:hypothetical protein